ncbi:GntR family transcriptional regulator [Neobacillus sp. DY30]|uniref:GntR family transcriptional regulator n=1 Tax=Neobacillus sp. DY30 TaxID=3047871 RepID=UPI0024BF2B5E|nr:GntR family transcriptional regulator [Neobacillus sp. DY30]WHY01314.1 GntR family transcriptional regulator [Neobacillus sp. DY30]
MLNVDHQEPLYIQLKKAIQVEILNEKFQQGERIPNEKELMEQYNVSRVTVRKAVEELVKEGYLVKLHGKGTFVSHTKIERKIKHVMGFTAACKANGYPSHSVVTKKEIVDPDTSIKKALQLEADEKAIFIQRKRFAGDSPLMLENNFYPYNRYYFLLEESLEGSLYDLLSEKHGIKPIKSGATTLDIVLADEEKANLLETTIGKPLFYMNTIIHDQHGRPVHIGRQYIIGDRYQFTI